MVKLFLIVENCENHQKIKNALLCLKQISFLMAVVGIYRHCLCFTLNKEAHKLISPFSEVSHHFHICDKQSSASVSWSCEFKYQMGNGTLQKMIFSFVSAKFSNHPLQVSHIFGVV